MAPAGASSGSDPPRARRPALAQVLEGQVLEHVAAAPGIDQVGREQRVETEPREVHAQPAEHDPVALGVGRDLADGAVLEQRAQQGERRGARERPLDVEAGVSERDVDRAALGPGERDPERLRTHRLGVGQHQGERDAAGRARRAGGGLDGGPVEQQTVVARAGLDLRCELARQPLELELLEEGVAGAAVGLAEHDCVEVELHRHVAAQRDELLREERVGRVALQPVPVGRALHLVGVRDHVLDRPELAHQVARALVADAGDAGHVVDRVAHQGQHVDDARRGHAPLLLDRLLVEDRGAAPLAARVQHPDLLAHQLEHVLVRGHDHDVEAARDGLLGERRDRVVRFEAGHLHDGQAEGLADPPDVGQLHHEVVVHLRAVGLVLLVLVVAERPPRRVEEDSDVLGLLVLQELAQHGGEAVGGVRGQTAAGREAADGVEGAVELAAAVDEVDGPGAGHGRIL